jgi:8-oxo-dGTP pyrophosphatase MutT (NUDIX family)
MDDNDLTLQIKDSILNLRVLLLISTPNGYIFEVHEDGFCFAIGGRIKLNESSMDAAKREFREEMLQDDIDLNLIGIVENFFIYKGIKYHEINFVYDGIINKNINLTELHSDHVGYRYIQPTEAETINIKPKAILNIFKTKKAFHHLINKDY